MEKFKYSTFSPLYRAEVAALENNENFYEHVDSEVERLLERTPQIHPTLRRGATPEETRSYWSKHAEETKFQIVQNSRYKVCVSFGELFA